MSASSVFDWLRSPRTALLVNAALVMTGSVLALLTVIDIFTGIIIVLFGFAGILMSLLGQRTNQTTEID